MKTPEQLKGTIRNIAMKKHLHPQEVLQMFFFERILERLALSRFQNNFILKGGLLISSMIGISERTTMDMDTTVQGIRMEEKEITDAMKEILVQDAGDNIYFLFRRIEYIREDDIYNNFRVHIDGRYGSIKTPMKIDITTGDVITPAAIRYHYPCMFEEKTIPIMGYPLETILAEKFETIIRRNIATTRAGTSMTYIPCIRNEKTKLTRIFYVRPLTIQSKNGTLLQNWKTGWRFCWKSGKNLPSGTSGTFMLPRIPMPAT